MKNLSNVINGLKLVLKYSAYVLVFVDILNFAIEKFESLSDKETSKTK